ncbi:MAG TPA: hypothetical protein VFI95_23640 [Terriglobales bacterium]|nr:hypothetical protein [Terriglobales bacterium]
MQELNEVLRRKKAQLEALGKQIAQLQAAADELRSIAHLLNEDENPHAHGR